MPALPEDSPFAEGFFKIFEAFAAAVRNYGDCNVYADKIDQWNRSKLLSSWLDVAEPMRCGFQVLNHGDIWLNNMMFKFDGENNPIDVSMIDFQGPFWGGPATDVLYFLLSSVADDIKIERFDDFVKLYHEQLLSALKQLNFDGQILSLDELYVDMLDKGFFGKNTKRFKRGLSLKIIQINIFRSMQLSYVHIVCGQIRLERRNQHGNGDQWRRCCYDESDLQQ